MAKTRCYSILLVEDDDSLRLTLRDFLTKEGYKVQVASDGVGAIKLMLDSKIDLMVTDYRMAVFGGDYWIRFLNKYCTDIRVIVTSGYLQPDFPIAFKIINKPFKFEDLSIAIAAELEKM